MAVQFIEESSSSKIVLRDFFPLYVLFSEEESDLLHHFDMVKFPTDCIEFACDYETNRLVRLNLVLARTHLVVHGPLELDDYPSGSLVLDMPAVTEASVFQSRIYDDGIEVILSGEKVASLCGSGDVCVGLDSRGCIARVFVLNMSSSAIKHAKIEMAYPDEVAGWPSDVPEKPKPL